MTPHPDRITSFAEVVLQEAAARQVRVSLMVKPVREGDDRQLSSRFLGLTEPGLAALATPVKPNGRKVFLPDGWNLGLGFAVGNLFIQARTALVGHCQFRLYTTCRTDAILIRRPERVTSVARRQETRYEVDPSDLTTATIWLEHELLMGGPTKSREGRVANWSESGLGIRLPAKVPFREDDKVVLRVEGLHGQTVQFYQGRFRHCSALPEGGYLVGFGEVAEIAPGTCVPLLEAVARGR